MVHIPINHRLRGFYRLLSGLIGAYLLTFGVVGAVRTWGDPLFERDGITALGLRTNLAFAVLSIIVGVVVLGGALIGRNVDHFINLIGAGVFNLAGLVMLLVMQTEANLLNFSVATCVVSFLIGNGLLLAGLYGKTGTTDERQAEEIFRHSGRGAVATQVGSARHRAHA